MSRAKKGRTSKHAVLLEKLLGVTRRIERGASPEEALEQMLWAAIDEVETPHLVKVPGGHPHAQEAIRCYLAIYARLNIAERMDKSIAAKVFPNLEDNDPVKRAAARENYATTCAFDVDCGWSLVKNTMSAALSLSKDGAIEKFVKMAPFILAAEITRAEAVLRMPSPAGAVFPLFGIEERLEAAGLLKAYCGIADVQQLVQRLKEVLEAPMYRDTHTGAEFSVVMRMLESTYRSLHCICAPEDADVPENAAYVSKQMELLGSRGISIERIFLYDDGEESVARAFADKQRLEAEQVLSQSSARGGSYKPYFVSRTVAQDVLIDPNFVSLAIFDRGTQRQRVATQLFRQARFYPISSAPTVVHLAAQNFDSLKSQSRE